MTSRPARLALILGVSLELACSSGGSDILLYGTLFDVAPSVLYSDPAGLSAHTLKDGQLTACLLEDPEAFGQGPDGLEGLRLVDADVGPDDGDFVLTHPDLVVGLPLALVTSAPGHAPTVFTGEVPRVSPDYPLFAFFDGALFSEEEQVLRDRVMALSPQREDAPDPQNPNNGGLLYGQLLQDPATAVAGEPQPVAGAQVRVSVNVGGTWQDAGQVHYLGDALEVDPDLSATSTSGIFYLTGCPAGIVDITVTPAGDAALPPFRTLSVEDGMSWLAAFYVVEN